MFHKIRLIVKFVFRLVIPEGSFYQKCSSLLLASLVIPAILGSIAIISVSIATCIECLDPFITSGPATSLENDLVLTSVNISPPSPSQDPTLVKTRETLLNRNSTDILCSFTPGVNSLDGLNTIVHVADIHANDSRESSLTGSANDLRMHIYGKINSCTYTDVSTGRVTLISGDSIPSFCHFPSTPSLAGLAGRLTSGEGAFSAISVDTISASSASLTSTSSAAEGVRNMVRIAEADAEIAE